MNATHSPARPMIAPLEEDPNAAIAGSSPPCFLHELDPVWLGYLGRDEVAELLEDLLAAEWPGTVLEAAWLRTMLRRHLDRLGSGPSRDPRRSTGGPQTDSKPGSRPAEDPKDRLAHRLRTALPRVFDDLLQRDLKDLLTIMERDLRWWCGAVTRPEMQAWAEVRAWRKAQRAVLIDRRLSLSHEARAEGDEAITARLAQVLARRAGLRRVGVYWPFKGEYDPRPLMRLLHGHGLQLLLPVVTGRARPLQFREWRPGIRMVPGVWGIPVPAEGDAILPDALVAPLVGFDEQGYRLGYGGGYYDRTLAALPERPFAIGVGFALSRLKTIHPQPHDIPMDLIVTEQGALQMTDLQPGPRRENTP